MRPIDIVSINRGAVQLGIDNGIAQCLARQVNIIDNKTVTINNNITLTIKSDKTLTINDGCILDNSGTLTNNGTLDYKGTLNSSGTLDGSGNVIVYNEDGLTSALSNYDQVYINGNIDISENNLDIFDRPAFIENIKKIDPDIYNSIKNILKYKFNIYRIQYIVIKYLFIPNSSFEETNFINRFFSTKL